MSHRLAPLSLAVFAVTLALAHPARAALFPQQAYFKASNTGENDQLGASVAVSGDTLVVAAPSEDSSATGVNGDPADNSAVDSGAAFVFVRSAGAWSQQAYLKASNTTAGARFGQSVAISGDTLVIGADSVGAGAAYVFVRNAGAWSQQAVLTPISPVAQFGYSVAISGDTIVVGSNFSLGAAFVFVRSSGAWSQQAVLNGSNTGNQDLFGRSVAISGDNLVVGAPFEDSDATGVDGDPANDSAADSGAAYVFRRSAGVWSQQAYLKASNTGADDQFGTSVAISGGTVVVGAQEEDSNATGVNGDPANDSTLNSGAAYVFVRSAGVWSQQAYLKASNTDVFSLFGSSLAIEGDSLVVTAPRDLFDSGAAYVFERRAGVWSQQAYLKASNADVGISGDWFGFSAVGLSGGTLVVGARYEDSNATGVNGDQTDNSAVNSGAAYVFVAAGADLEMAKTADISDPDPGDTVVFTLTATNRGPDGATGVTVTDTLPAGLTYGSSDCGAAFTSSTLTWTVGPLANLASATCHLTVTVAAGASGTIVNTAAVTASEEDPNPDNNDAGATLTVKVADLKIQKTADTLTPMPGGTVAFTLTATNQGPTGATGVTVTDMLPAGLTYGSNDCGAAFAGSTLTWTVGALANLASATCHLTVTVAAGASGNIVNTAAVDGNEFDPQTGNDHASATLIVKVPDLTGYYTLPPCRLVDTRRADGPLGGPALAANAARDFVLAGTCGIPADAVAVVLTVTAVGPSVTGGLQIYPAGGTPLFSGGTVRYRASVNRAGNGVLALGAGGAVSAFAEQSGGTVHLILDVAGYFR